MLRVVTDQGAIRRAQDRWNQHTKDAKPQEYRRKLGWQGGEAWGSIYWHPSLGLWEAHMEETNRWWNPCGLDDPGKDASPDIVVEINPPYVGDVPGIAGAFADTDDGRTFLIHRGFLGGGRYAVSKVDFFRLFEGNTETLVGAGGDPVAVVADLGSPTFLADLVRFAQECRRIKKLVHQRKTGGSS